MNQNEIIRNLIVKAEHDRVTAKDLFNLGHYDWCLFIWHLAIEKVLKAHLLHEGKEIIFVHDLVRLAKQTNLSFSEEVIDKLREITTYNLEARYDDYKLSFYKKADKDYTAKWIIVCEYIYTFIIKEINGY